MVEWLENACFYEIYPQSFMDTNGDGIGDIPGIIQKLDYIKDLGCNAIWINPCFVSPFRDAGYDVEDYYKVAPRYGTNEDLRQLFVQAHEKGIRILLDLVPGHTALTHPWFLESMKPEKNIYSDRYIWTDSIEKNMADVSGIRSTLHGISQRNGACGVNCFSTQPALNYGFAKITASWQCAVDSQAALATRAELKNVMRFWLGMGCDGFRVDMAGSLVKNDEDRAETIKLWQDIRAFLEEEFPEAVLVAEWGSPDKSLKAGFHMDFFLHFGDTGYMDLFRCEHPFFHAEGKGDISVFVNTYKRNAEITEGKGLMCMPTGNHDMPRISYQLDEMQLRLAYSFIYSLPGAPFLYYGDEIGMRYLPEMISVEGAYNRTGSRTPMQWNRTTNAGFSSAAQDMMYLALDPDKNRPDVEHQKKDTNSLYHFVKKLIHLRNENSALKNTGSIEFLYAEDHKYPFVYKRFSTEEEILVVINPSGAEQECKAYAKDWSDLILSYNGEVRINGDKMLVPACSVNFIKI